jgi:sugar/nucleoside kinase (ribokinase family)
MLLGSEDPMSGLPEISSRFGCSVVGITRGRRGSVLYCGNQFIETDGFEVPGGCRDTTGAGDAFRVGIIYGLLQGRSVEESALMANAVAALKCRALGARTALPREPELREFLTSTVQSK